jgi:hypothetical protein
MFGINEKGETASIIVEDFKPFFYVMVNDKWSKGFTIVVKVRKCSSSGQRSHLSIFCRAHERWRGGVDQKCVPPRPHLSVKHNRGTSKEDLTLA